MRFSQQQVLDHELKLKVAAGKKRPAAVSSGDEREVGRGGLHEKIMRHCDAQWPKWKYIHARTDQRSTVGIGVHDFTIYLPGGRVLNAECKTRDGKPTPEQLAWALQLEMLGHKVHVVRSMDEFLAITSEGLPQSP